LAVEGAPNRVWTANFLGIRVLFDDRGLDLLLRARRLQGEHARNHSHHIHKQHSSNARAPYPALVNECWRLARREKTTGRKFQMPWVGKADGSR
jgi:hypothetical protein